VLSVEPCLAVRALFFTGVREGFRAADELARREGP
jgi:hypothetical protein